MQPEATCERCGAVNDVNEVGEYTCWSCGAVHQTVVINSYE